MVTTIERVLVVCQVLLATTWYTVMCSNPTPALSTQLGALVRNFI
jgi:hypothetical protein